jgi:hypothetical protein
VLGKPLTQLHSYEIWSSYCTCITDRLRKVELLFCGSIRNDKVDTFRKIRMVLLPWLIELRRGKTPVVVRITFVKVHLARHPYGISNGDHTRTSLGHVLAVVQFLLK